MLDHLSHGRLMVGVGAGAYPNDARIHGSQDTHPMMLEAVEIMLAVWQADGAFHYQGRYWTVDFPEHDAFLRGPHWKPFQQPHPPLAMAGLSLGSSTLRQAGQRGFIPMSFNVGREYLASHWYRYVERDTVLPLAEGLASNEPEREKRSGSLTSPAKLLAPMCRAALSGRATWLSAFGSAVRHGKS